MYAWRFGNQLPHRAMLDADGRLTQLYGGVQHVDYGYNPVDQLTAMSDYGNPAATQTIDYDAVDRVGNVYRSGDQQGFAWDQAGNRLVHARQGASYSSTPDSQSNRLASWSGNGQFRHFAYDAVGNLASESRHDGTRQYTYDAFNRMTAFISTISITAITATMA